jgi:Ca2+-binding EF-hand superfamily protein
MGAASLEAAFSEYDQQPAYLGRGGLLDRDEFAVVCKAMGFSARAEFIFRSLDKDRSGEIGYEELTEAIEAEGCVLLMMASDGI